jgi:excinuclease ABC subunit B
MRFKLKSSFQPTGDQPQAINSLIQSVQSGSKHQTLLGVTGSGKTFTAANVIQATNLPTLIISHNKTLAGQLYQEFRDFFPENAVSYFVSYYDYYQPEAYIPSTDTYIEKETQINDEIDKLRLSSTANLLTRPDTIVVASVSCIYNLGSPLEYAKNFIELVPGQIIARDVLFRRLIDIQYTRSDFELRRGSFRVTGDTLTIWPANLDYALKFSLLENQIESITPIDPTTGVKIKSTLPGEAIPTTPRYYIYPAKHYMTAAGKSQDAVFEEIKTDLALRLKELKNQGKIVEAYRLAQKVKHDLEMIKELGFVNGIENYSRYFDGRQPGDPPYTLIDYFHYNAKQFKKDGFLTIIDESHITLPQLRGMHAGDKSRKQTLIDYGFRLPSALDNRPLTYPEINDRLPKLLYASATPTDLELSLSKPHIAEQLIRPTGLIDPAIEIRPSEGQITNLIYEIIATVAKGQRVLVTTLTKRTAEALTEYLNDESKLKKLLKEKNFDKSTVLPKVQYLHADVETLDRQDILDSLRAGEYDVVVGINLLREGLDLPEVSLVAILEADKEGFLRSKTSLIQTMGRAARHIEGRVIMYADRHTPSMEYAIKEVNRRRDIQTQYNLEHHITPQSIDKPIRDKLLVRPDKTMTEVPKNDIRSLGFESINDINPQTLTPKDKTELSKKLTRLMNRAAKDWDFESAARYRDKINELK